MDFTEIGVLPNTYEKQDIQDAFAILTQLLYEGVVDNKELLIKYRKSEVNDILNFYTEAFNSIILDIGGEHLYLVRNMDNSYLSYTEDDIYHILSGVFKSDNSKRAVVHLVYIIMLFVVASFYDSENVSYTPDTQFIPVFEIAENLKETMEYVRNEYEPVIEELTAEYELNLIGAANLIIDYGLGKPDSKDFGKTKTIIGLVLRVTDFLKKEGLITYYDETNIRLTDKMKDLIEYYYFNESRKEQLLGLINLKLKSMKQEFDLEKVTIGEDK